MKDALEMITRRKILKRSMGLDLLGLLPEKKFRAIFLNTSDEGGLGCRTSSSRTARATTVPSKGRAERPDL